MCFAKKGAENHKWSKLLIPWKYKKIVLSWAPFEVTYRDLIHRLKSKNRPVEHNKEYFRKVLVISCLFFDTYSLDFFQQTQRREVL